MGANSLRCTDRLMYSLNSKVQQPVGLTQKRAAEALLRIEKPVGLRQKRLPKA